MSVDQFAEQELAHIARIVSELERLLRDGQVVAGPNAVVQPEYWRKRIDALAKSSLATTDTIRRAAGLLQRLSHLSKVLDGHERSAERN
jgi:hypothetical protein